MKTKNEYQAKLNEAKTIMDLADLAGTLNNNKAHINVDKVTCLGFMSFEYGKAHVQRMIDTLVGVS
jgi:hypothetical protein